MKPKVEARADAVHVTLGGNIDESFGFAADSVLQAVKGAARIVLDIRDVRAMNSIGAKQWLRLIDDLPAGAAYEFLGVPPVFVSYGLLVRSLFGKGRITSLSVPYLCPKCHRIFEADVTMDAVRAGDLGEHRCSRCGNMQRSAIEPSDLSDFCDAVSGS